MNTQWIICVSFAFLWLLKSIAIDDDSRRPHSITNSTIYLAASFVIIAIEHAAK